MPLSLYTAEGLWWVSHGAKTKKQFDDGLLIPNFNYKVSAWLCTCGALVLRDVHIYICIPRSRFSIYIYIDSILWGKSVVEMNP